MRFFCFKQLIYKRKLFKVKYILYFKENSNNFNDDIVFQNNDWTIIKPSSYESCCHWCQGTDWKVADGDHNYYFQKDTYIVISNENPLFSEMNDMYYICLNNAEFYDKEENTLYFKEFLDKSSVLYNFFAEITKCSNIKEDNGEWWVVVSDYSDFAEYFKLDRDTRNDLIKIILSGDYFTIFNYNSSDFTIKDQNIDLTKDNLTFLKCILRLEQAKGDDHDYDMNDIKDYNDVANVVKEYGIESLEKAMKYAICNAQESADGSAAWDDIVDEIYKFFNLEMGSAKWKKTEGFKYDALWIKFKSKSDAMRAKFIFVNYDDSFDDDNKINYSTPYNGYYGDSKDVEENFNEYIADKVDTAYENGNSDVSIEEINDFYEYWQEEKKKNPNSTDDEIAKEIQYLIDAKRYNV